MGFIFGMSGFSFGMMGFVFAMSASNNATAAADKVERLEKRLSDAGILDREDE
ncbi:MAG: hypothetical protein AAGG48_31035 [Planctomycetota bacterium]